MANYSGLKNPELTNRYEKVTMVFNYDDNNVITYGSVLFNAAYDPGVNDTGDCIEITALLDKSKELSYQFGISKNGDEPCYVEVTDYNGDEILYEDLDPKFTFAQNVPLIIYLDDGKVVFGPTASMVLSQYIAGNLPANKVWDVDEVLTNPAGGDYYVSFLNWQPVEFGIFLLIAPKHDFNIIDLCNTYFA